MTGLLRFIGNIVVWVSLGLGAVAAATAYLVPVSLATKNADIFVSEVTDEGEKKYLEITADAGPKIAIDGEKKAMFPEGTALTPENVAKMIGEDPSKPLVKRVKVKSFSFARWDTWWWFASAVFGLIVGGLTVKFTSRPREDGGDIPVEQTPTGALTAALAVVQAVHRDAPLEADLEDALRLVSDRLGELQQTHLAVFGEARAVLISRLGLGGFAAMMDRFAEGERAVNRAWSAAADGRVGRQEQAADMLAESMASLEIAAVSLDEALARLG